MTMTNTKRAGVLALSALLCASAAVPGQAAPITKLQIAAEAASQATPVYWRGRPWGWGGGWGPGWGPRYGYGWSAPAVVGGLIIGGALVATAVAEHRAADAAMRRCAEDFPSFDPRTGTFRNRYGERRVCPYLY
jgi:hypothetical protein